MEGACGAHTRTKKLTAVGLSNYFKRPLGKSACFSMFSHDAAAEFRSVCEAILLAR